MAVSGSAGDVHGHSPQRRLPRPARRVISAKRRRLQIPSSRARSERAPRAPVLKDVGFWPRVGAFVIDGMVLDAARRLIEAAVPVTFAAGTAGGAGRDDVSPAASFIYLLFVPLYFVLMNGAYGATLGKMMHGYRVVNEDGSRIGYGVALLRCLLAAVFGAFTLNLFFVSVAIDPKHRGWHDRLLGTRVIYDR